MNEPPPIDPTPQAPAKPMPLLARMMNVFAVPSEVFEDVRRSPNAPGSWVVPILVACVVGILTSLVLFSQPAILQEVRTMRVKAMDQAVEKGKLTQAQADEALAQTERFMTPTLLKVFGSLGSIVVSFVRVFWWAFAIWLLALLFIRTRIPFLKALEVAGLSSLIGTLGLVVNLLLQINLGRTTATSSLALAVSDFDPSNKFHLVLSALNLVQVWMILVLGLGLAKLTHVPFMRTFLLLVALYCLQTSMLILMGAGMSMM